MKRVVVIGAGPAGSAAAMSLTRQPRLQVVLLERGYFPRRKVCGSGLSPWALTLLDRLGVGARIRKEAYPIRAGIISGSQGQRVELRGRYEAAVLLRERLDTVLAHEAARRGAMLHEGVRVERLLRDQGRLRGVKTSAGEIEADAIIVCNGANSRLAPADRPGQTLHAILGWYEGCEGIADAVELYFDAAVQPYYGWVFPESPTRVNIGICYAPRPGGPNARQRFAAFLERCLGKRLKYATPVGGLVGHPIATTYQPASLVEPGTLLAGEAGRLVDPATAEGIHHALASGWLAGRFLGALLEQGGELTPQRLRPYTQLVRQRIGPRLRTGQLFLNLTRTPALDLALRLGSLSPIRSLLTWLLAGA
jgi:geranylgeranyl reductase family protein